ncbi:nuclease [Microbacterium sp. NPDC076895]|uniref:nuclease n=1 Tax=Microbacterium sp. NPDC076895 TaxID=3154957 RepID=UPI003412F82E
MSRTISSTVLPIQRAMASANPSAWTDGLVTDASGTEVTIALLTGAPLRLRVVGPAVELVAGEPVAYHPVAELLSASVVTTTARPA